jgi:DNA-binding transcriptional ArsR family regulator
MAKRPLSHEVLELVAGRFKALSEPARLQILQSLRSGERTVTELAGDTGLGQANLSRHLRMLDALGFVSRRKDGLFAYYALADESVFRLCEITCGRLEANARTRARTLAR